MTNSRDALASSWLEMVIEVLFIWKIGIIVGS